MLLKAYQKQAGCHFPFISILGETGKQFLNVRHMQERQKQHRNKWRKKTLLVTRAIQSDTTTKNAEKNANFSLYSHDAYLRCGLNKHTHTRARRGSRGGRRRRGKWFLETFKKHSTMHKAWDCVLRIFLPPRVSVNMCEICVCVCRVCFFPPIFPLTLPLLPSLFSLMCARDEGKKSSSNIYFFAPLRYSSFFQVSVNTTC